MTEIPAAKSKMAAVEFTIENQENFISILRKATNIEDWRKKREYLHSHTDVPDFYTMHVPILDNMLRDEERLLEKMRLEQQHSDEGNNIRSEDSVPQTTQQDVKKETRQG